MAITTNTIRTYALDGATKQFQVPFDYLSRSFVRVSYISASGQTQLLVAGTDFQWTSNTTIETTAVPDNSKWVSIEVRRYTSTTQRVVTFQDGSILHATDLNRSELQAMHIAEEARDAAAMGIGQNTDGNMDSKLRRIVNVANAVNPNDAVNFGQVTAIQNSVTSVYNDTVAVKGQVDALHTDTQALRNAVDIAHTHIEQVDIPHIDLTKSLVDAAHAHIENVDIPQIQNLLTQATAEATIATTSASEASTSASGALHTLDVVNTNGASYQAAAALSATQSATSATASKTDADRSKTEADRAKAEADKIAGQNILTNAIAGVGASPTYTVDFVSLPTVGGKPLNEVAAEGGLQINSHDIVTVAGGEDCNSASYAGKTFVVEKGALNAPTIKNAKAVVTDVYGFIGADKQRMQMCYEADSIHVRQQQLTSNLWDDWVTLGPSIAETIPDSADLNSIPNFGNFTFVNPANNPVPSDTTSVKYLMPHMNESGTYMGMTAFVKNNGVIDQYQRYKTDANTWTPWVKVGSNFVTLDTQQTITGKKTVKGDGDILVVQNNDPAQATYIKFLNSSGSTPFGYVGKIGAPNDMAIANPAATSSITLSGDHNIYINANGGNGVIATQSSLQLKQGVDNALRVGTSSISFQGVDSSNGSGLTRYHISAGGNLTISSGNEANDVLTEIKPDGSVLSRGTYISTIGSTATKAIGFMKEDGVSWIGGMERQTDQKRMIFTHEGKEGYSIKGDGKQYINGLGRLQLIPTALDSSPILEWHYPTKVAYSMYPEANGNFKFCKSAGDFNWVKDVFTTNDTVFTHNTRIEVPSVTAGWDDWNQVPITVGFAGGTQPVATGSWCPVMASPTYQHNTQGYLSKWEIGHFRFADNNNGGMTLRLSGDGLVKGMCLYHFAGDGIHFSNNTSGNSGDFHLRFDGMLIGSAWGGQLNDWISTYYAPKSDEKLKENIKDSTTNALNIVNQMKFKSFDWKDGSGHVEVGQIAQELEQVGEGLVKTVETFNDDGSVKEEESFKIVDTLAAVNLALKAIQELSERVTKLESKL